MTAVALVAALAVGCGATATGSPDDETAPSSAGTAATATDKAGAVRLRLVRVARGLSSPVYATAPSSEPNRLYVVEQAGRIRIVENGKLRSAPFLDIVSQVKSGGEQGLLSVAFHPRYASNGLFYVDYTDRNGDTRVVEYRRTGGSPERVRELLSVDQPYSNHNGGQLAFGPDGLLYVGMGDGGAGGDPENRAQNLSSRLGKLLRIDVDRQGADWQIAGYGLRNPWRFSFDRANGDLYIADVGQGEWEEIDWVARSDSGLKNYGWDVFEGTHSFEDKDPNGEGTLVRPIYEYSHSEGCSVTGGYVYRGKKLAGIQGRYFFGDYCTGTIWSLVEKDGKATQVRKYPFKVGQLSSFGENARGDLFLVSQDGSIYRLAKG
jgi:glucose/arabinose dehydrogenase